MNEAVREFLHILFKRKRFVAIAFLAISTCHDLDPFLRTAGRLRAPPRPAP